MYGITLSHDQRWQMIATQTEKELLRQMAFIMELTPCGSNEDPKLLLASYDSNLKECLKTIAASYPNKATYRWKNSWKTYMAPYLHQWYHPALPDIICRVLPELNRERKIVALCQALYPVYAGVIDSGGLPLHSALIERHGAGILLIGPGETGKSTCCSRIPLPWRPLSDDETLLVVNEKKQYLAHPFPTWSNHLLNRSDRRTWNVQRHIRLAAIFFLKQADEDEVEPMGQGQAAVGLNRSAVQILERYLRNVTPEEERKIRLKTIENACGFAQSIPAYTLRFTRTGAFWEEIEKVMTS